MIIMYILYYLSFKNWGRLQRQTSEREGEEGIPPVYSRLTLVTPLYAYPHQVVFMV